MIPSSITRSTDDILKRLLDGGTLPPEDAVFLLEKTAEQGEQSLYALQECVATVKKRQKASEKNAIADVPLYLTNMCEMQPVVYSYPRPEDAKDAFILTIDDIDARIEAGLDRGADTVFIHGGFWSAMRIPGLEAPTVLKTHERLLKHMERHYPRLNVTGYSPDEIDFLRIVSDKSSRYILESFYDKGLRELSGYGADILKDQIRKQVSPKKMPVKDWLKTAAIARKTGLTVTATMTFGHKDNMADRVDHLDVLRDFLARNPGAFSRFIPQAMNASLMPSEERLAMIAVIRLFLGEILHDQSVCAHPDLTGEFGAALEFGANHRGAPSDWADTAFLLGSHHLDIPSASELNRLR